MANMREYEMLFRLNANSSGNFGRTFGDAQKTILQLQNQINALNKAQGDITAYQRQQQSIENTRKKLEVYQQQLANVQREMSGAESYSSVLANKEVDLQAKIDKTAGSLNEQTGKLNTMGAALSQAGIDVKNLSGSSEQLRAKIADLKSEEEAAAEEAAEFGESSSQAFEDIKQALVAAGIAKALQEIFEYYQACADASMQFETAMTGVAKTTDLTDQEFAAMSSNIKAMSEDIPATTTELAAIAETAGQLGTAKNDLLDFTEIMAMLGTATNMTSDEAATMLAQFASITGMDPSYYSNLGSTIVDLGNNYATTERNVADMSQTIAAAGSIAGMTEADILGVSAAVTSLGVTSQVGGTAMAKLISDINTAVASGEGLSDWAAAAGMTANDFAVAWGNNAAGALNMFIRGLNATYAAGGDVYSILSDLGITETRMVTMIASLAKSGDRLTNTLSTANQAWTKNTALTAEAEKRYATTQSQLTLMQNAYNNLQVAIGDNYNPALQKAYELGAELFSSLAAFVQENPQLVKAFTAMTIAVSVFAVGLIAYTVAVNIAKAATNAFTAALSANPVFLAITAIAALTAGIVALAASVESAVPDIKDLTDAALEMSEVAEQANQTYEDSVTSIDAASTVANRYIDRLEELEAAGIRTKEQQLEYHNTLVLLTQTVPELSKFINLQTDAINGSTESLHNNVAAWKTSAIQQAGMERITAIQEKYGDVVIEAAENTILLTEAQEALKAAQQQEADTVARMNQLWEEARQKLLAYRKENKTYGGTVRDFLTPEYDELNDSLNDTWEAQSNAQDAIDACTEAIAEDKETIAQYEGEVALAEQAVENLTEAEAAAAAAAEEAAEQEAAVNGAIEETEGAIADLIAAYDEAYNAAKGSIEGQYNLWDEAADVVAQNITDMNDAIDSQTEYWQNYNANLAALNERADDIEGLGEMIGSFADGSPESVAAIAGMANATDEELAAMVTSWKDLQQEQELTANSIAELATDFKDSMDMMLTDLSNTITGMDMSEEAADAAEATVLAYIGTIDSQVGKAYAAARSVAAAVQRGFESWGGPPTSGYASGTLDAEPGWKWVGELGPELMYMHGGEAVIPSNISMLMAEMAGTREAGSNAISASISPYSGMSRISINPVYNIAVGSAADAEELRDALSRINDDLVDRVIEKIDDRYADNRRCAYI